jgi:hypothetical protein
VGGSPIEYWLPPTLSPWIPPPGGPDRDPSDHPDREPGDHPPGRDSDPARDRPPSPDRNPCESDLPQCDNQFNDSWFFTDIVSQFVPYTLGAIVWDQVGVVVDRCCSRISRIVR